MRRLALCILTAALTPVAAFAQADRAPAPAASTIHASARLVVVDVTVTDGHGDPVQGLKPEDFHLLEDKKPQKVRSFEEHNTVPGHASATTEPALQAGVFSNAVAATDSPVNILLLDMLNTPTRSQAFVHDQLVKYLNAAKPGTRIAIFALTDRLIMLQGLTTDLTALRVAVARSHPQRSFRADPANNTTGAEGALVAPLEAQLAAVSPLMADALEELTASERDTETGLAVQETLQAMNQLARYLAGIPGRKNLIWFSDSFPMILNPPLASGNTPQLGEGRFSSSSRWAYQYGETMDLLARSRVAIFPVDARGLKPHGGMSDGEFESRSTMMQMAEDTGGKAFFNTNGLAQAVEQVVDSGANYYTLTYAPNVSNAHDEYRNIRVQMEGGYTLTYRHGYYAEKDDPTASLTAADTFKAALRYTSPPATQIQFFAHVQPPAAPVPAEAESLFTPASHAVSPAAHRSLTPDHFLHYQVEFSSDPRALSVSEAADGLRHSHVEYIVLVYDAQGRIVNSSVKGVQVTWTPAQFTAALQKGVRFQTEVGLPSSGSFSLRMMIHDMANDKIGAVDVPFSSVPKVEKP